MVQMRDRSECCLLDARHHGVDPNRIGDVLDEVDEHADAEECQQERPRDGHLWKELISAVDVLAHGEEARQAVSERRNEGAQDQAGAEVPKEEAQ